MPQNMHTTQGFEKPSWRFRLSSAAFAGVMWGSWAWWVNSGASAQLQHAPWSEALTQGVGSFLITLVMVQLVTWFYYRLPRATQVLLPALITVLLTGTCLVTAHTLAGTQNVFRTITPALSVAFLFNIYTAIKLRYPA